VRIFLDANILFSASKSDGAIRRLLSITQQVGHVLCADDYVVAEAWRNLEAKAKAGTVYLESLIATMEVAPFRPGELPDAIARQLPEKDRLVLAAAIRLRCEVLVTGDRTHFSHLYDKVVGGVAVLTPRALAARLGFAQ
jgi:predicted nucleic acid-binding protein